MIMETLELGILEAIGENSEREGLTDTAIIMYESREEIGIVLDAYKIILNKMGRNEKIGRNGN